MAKKSKEPLPKVTVKLVNGETWDVTPLAVKNGLAVTPVMNVGGFEAEGKWVVTLVARGAQITEVFDRKTKCITAMEEIADLADWTLDTVNFANDELRFKIHAICAKHLVPTPRIVKQVPDGMEEA